MTVVTASQGARENRSAQQHDVVAALRNPERLEILKVLALSDNQSEPAFDRLTRLATKMLHAPVALVSLVDADQQLFKGCIGLPEPWASRRSTPLSHSFCQYVVASDEPLIIEDARVHPLVSHNLAIEELGVIAYAGIPLRTPSGLVLGSFCIIDHVPRIWSQDELAILEDLAAAASTEIELRAEIVERRQAEAALRESEAHQRAILDTALDAIVTIDYHGYVTEFNPAAERIFGYRRSDVLGKDLATLIIPTEFRLQHYKGMDHYLNTGEGIILDKRIEIPAQRADDTQFPVELAVTRIHLDGPPAFTAYIRDITERKQAEDNLQRAKQELEMRVTERTSELAVTNEHLRLELAERQRMEADLRESESRFRQMFEANQAIQIVVEPLTGSIVNANPAACYFYGYSWDELIHTSIFEIDIQPASELTKAIERAAKERHSSFLFEHRLASGEIRQVEAFASPIIVQGQQYLFAIIIDITERRRAEAGLLESNAQLKTALQAKDEMIQNTSHELRTPLTHIRGYAEVLLEGMVGEVTEEQSELLNTISEKAAHLNRLVDNLLALQTAGNEPLNWERIAVEPFLNVLAATWKRQANAAQVMIETQFPAGPLWVWADRSRLGEACDQLLENALKFSTKGGMIRLQADSTATHVRLGISDTGIGISPEEVGHIFERFYQADGSTTRRYGGLGIGLSLVEQIVEAHHGKISVQSPGWLDCGTTFIIELPVQNPEAPYLTLLQTES